MFCWNKGMFGKNLESFSGSIEKSGGVGKHNEMKK